MITRSALVVFFVIFFSSIIFSCGSSEKNKNQVNLVWDVEGKILEVQPALVLDKTKTLPTLKRVGGILVGVDTNEDGFVDMNLWWPDMKFVENFKVGQRISANFTYLSYVETRIETGCLEFNVTWFEILLVDLERSGC